MKHFLYVNGRKWVGGEGDNRTSSTPKPNANMPYKQSRGVNQRGDQKRPNASKATARPGGQTMLAPNHKGEMSVIMENKTVKTVLRRPVLTRTLTWPGREIGGNLRTKRGSILNRTLGGYLC